MNHKKRSAGRKPIGDSVKDGDIAKLYFLAYHSNWITIYEITIDDDRVSVGATDFEDLTHLDEQITEDIMADGSVFITETLAKCEDIDLVIYDGYNQVSGRYEFRVEYIN